MTNLIKTISITLLITLSMAFISCKNDETDPNGGSFKKSDLIGNWTGNAGSFTINGSGNVNFVYEGTTYNNTVIYLYQFEEEGSSHQASSYDNQYDANASHSDGDTRKLASFSFSSSSSCIVYIREDTYSGGDWQLGNANSIGAFTKN